MARKKKRKRSAAVPEPDPDPNSQLDNTKSHGHALCPPENADHGKCDFISCASEKHDSCAALVDAHVDADASPSKASCMVNPVKNDVSGSPVVALTGGQVLSLSPISVMEDILPDGKVSLVASYNDGSDRASNDMNMMWSAWLTAPYYSESMAFADDQNMTMCLGVLLEGGLISPASNVHLRPIQRMIQLGAFRIIAGFMRRHVIKWTLQPFLRLHKYSDA